MGPGPCREGPGAEHGSVSGSPLTLSRPLTLSAHCCFIPILPGRQTYWLLLAISQDQPRNQAVASLRDRCEQAALEGHWELPFADSKMQPLSPLRPARVSSSGGLGGRRRASARP